MTLKENRMTRLKFKMMKIFPLIAIITCLGGCETLNTPQHHHTNTFTDSSLLNVIESMNAGTNRGMAGGRIAVESTYPSATGALCKVVTLTSPQGKTDHKLACFEGDRGRFILSPFLNASQE